MHFEIHMQYAVKYTGGWMVGSSDGSIVHLNQALALKMASSPCGPFIPSFTFTVGVHVHLCTTTFTPYFDKYMHGAK